MFSPIVYYLILISTAGDGLLAGAGMDYAIKQLPARHRIGIEAYSKFFKASDLANGRFWYIPLGIAMYISNVGSALSSLLTGEASPVLAVTSVAAVATVVHLIGTSQVAPAGLSVPKIPQEDDPADKNLRQVLKVELRPLRCGGVHVRRHDARARPGGLESMTGAHVLTFGRSFGARRRVHHWQRIGSPASTRGHLRPSSSRTSSAVGGEKLERQDRTPGLFLSIGNRLRYISRPGST